MRFGTGHGCDPVLLIKSAGILLCVAVVVIITIIFADINFEIFTLIRNKLAWKAKVRATVVKKHSTRLDLSYKGVDMAEEDDTDVRDDCFITFAFKGKSKEYSVSGALYYSVELGDWGNLLCKGNRVIHFERIGQAEK